VDAGDLIVGLGRLAFASPRWIPSRVRRSSLRDPAGLALDPGPRSRLFPGSVSCRGDQLDGGSGEPGEVPCLAADIDPDVEIADP
jgi:hypothetical protein